MATSPPAALETSGGAVSKEKMKSLSGKAACRLAAQGAVLCHAAAQTS